MKKFITSISLLAGLTIGAQNSEFQISVCVSQSLSSSPAINSLMVQFSNFGSDFTDSLDSTWPMTNPSLSYPYSINASSTMLRIRDSRPVLRAERNLAFGVWNVSSGDLHIRGMWNNPTDSLLYTAVLIENATGTTYNLYNECQLPYTGDTSYATPYTVRFIPKILSIAGLESCYGMNDGTLYVKSGETNWTLDIYKNSVFVNTYNIAGNDTLFTGLGQGSYDLVYSLDNNVIDTTTAVISGPAQIISSATLSNASPLVNESVDFTNTSTGAVTYFWDFGDGNTSTDASPSHAYATMDSFTITLTAYNANGCSETATFAITVSSFSIQGPPVNLSNRNEQQTNTARVITTVQSQNNSAALTTAGDATISQFSVYSVNGQLLLMGSANDNTFTYDAPGIYFIQILYSNGATESQQLYLN